MADTQFSLNVQPMQAEPSAWVKRAPVFQF